MCSLCKLESTINILATSRVKSRTITGRVSMPSFAHAYFLPCPEIGAYLSPSPFLTRTGLMTPNVEMLSTSYAISSSSRTPNGWSVHRQWLKTELPELSLASDQLNLLLCFRPRTILLNVFRKQNLHFILKNVRPYAASCSEA